MKVHSTAIAVILSAHGTVVFGLDSSNVRGANKLKDEPEKQLIPIEPPVSFEPKPLFYFSRANNTKYILITNFHFSLEF